MSEESVRNAELVKPEEPIHCAVTELELPTGWALKMLLECFDQELSAV